MIGTFIPLRPVLGFRGAASGTGRDCLIYPASIL